MSYKDEIEKCVRLVGDGLFTEPKKEYRLNIQNNDGKADFCWKIGLSGWLFIEDEDNNSQRALSHGHRFYQQEAA
jgi:hypothetical protein